MFLRMMGGAVTAGDALLEGCCWDAPFLPKASVCVEPLVTALGVQLFHFLLSVLPDFSLPLFPDRQRVPCCSWVS